MRAKLPAAAPAIAVIGGGVVGMACAFELRRRGAAVSVRLDRSRPPTSLVAAGMLGPAFELGADPSPHPGFAELCLYSAGAWPEFADLLGVGGDPPRIDRTGTLACAGNGMGTEELDRLAAVCRDLELPCDILSASEAARLEPMLEPGSDMLRLPGDVQIDVDAVLKALRLSLRALGVRFEQAPLREVRTVPGGRFALDDDAFFDALLFATGAATRFSVRIDGSDARLVDDGAMLPVKGEILVLARGARAPRHVVRSGSVYIVPKQDRILVGATSLPGIDDIVVDADRVAALRAAAERLCPGLRGLPELARRAGVRPGSADHAPYLGEGPVPGLHVAAGHFRNGFLLAPATARVIADRILGGPAQPFADAFPARGRYPVNPLLTGKRS